jgi:hypothetical protein
MNRTIATRIFAAVIGLAAMLTAGTAAAEYRVTAFGNAKAYTALISKNLSDAEIAFSRSKLEVLDFGSSNNLCVTKILGNELDEAVGACEAALEKLNSEIYISASSEKAAKASIYSNLAVAKALGSDLSAASTLLEISLSHNPDDENAQINYELIAASFIAQN